MNNERLIVEKLIEEVAYRYGVNDYVLAERLLHEALEDENVQEHIYDVVYELILGCSQHSRIIYNRLRKSGLNSRFSRCLYINNDSPLVKIFFRYL